MALQSASDLQLAPALALRELSEVLLDDAAAACDRLADEGDSEALHDLRVALRRLQSLLRAYRRLLPHAAARKKRRPLRDLMRRLGEARDLQVHLEWLRGQRNALAEHGATVDAMIAELARRMERAMERVRDEAAARFRRVRRRLVRRLERDAQAANQQPGPTFAAATSERILAQAAELLLHAASIATARDEIEAHAARICAKRLRYLVEPLREAAPDCRDAASALTLRLKALQDLLGDLHDAHTMAHVVESALIAAARSEARRAHRLVAGAGVGSAQVEPLARSRAGLLALDRLVCARRDQLFAELLAARQGRAIDEIVASASALARLLADTP